MTPKEYTSVRRSTVAPRVCSGLDHGSEPTKWPVAVTVGAAMLVFYLILWRPQAKKDKERQEQLYNVKKNDRVLTIGGIYWTVMDVKGDEVVLKIDEATNTKIHISTAAISKNLSQEGKE
mgnify:CR=1 FL=1